MYLISLEIFQGPLDLLLHLVDRNKLDITEIALASLVEEYRAYLDHLLKMELEIESSFLTVFASLLQIKSKILLPAPPADEEEEIPEHELVEKLREYKKLKEMGTLLEEMKQKAEACFLRPAQEIETHEELVFTTQLDPQDLMDIYVSVMRRFSETPDTKTIELEKEQISFPFILRMISKKIKARLHTGFHELFDSAPEKIEFIVTFLALLEMARQKHISLIQQENDSNFIIVNKKYRENKKTGIRDKMAS
ncbi:MAG: segregation and condensation protein A [Vulcanimicrobiota bacterium]